MILRQVDIKDCKQLLQLYIRMEEELRVLDQRIQYNHFCFQRAKEELLSELSASDSIVIIAEVDEILVGAVQGRIQRIPGFSRIFGMVVYCYVIPEKRRLGIGKRLLESFYISAKERGAGFLSAQLMNAQNAGKKLMESEGMKPYLYRFYQKTRKAEKNYNKKEHENKIVPMNKERIMEAIPFLQQLEAVEMDLDLTLC